MSVKLLERPARYVPEDPGHEPLVIASPPQMPENSPSGASSAMIIMPIITGSGSLMMSITLGHRPLMAAVGAIVMIASVIVAGRRFVGQDFRVATWLAWGASAGALAQLLVQLPSVIGLLGGDVRPSLTFEATGVRATLKALGPVIVGRGSVQISGYVDQILASYLGPGLVAALANAQTLYLLPVAVLGTAVSAAELPEMSSALGSEAALPFSTPDGTVFTELSLELFRF